VGSKEGKRVSKFRKRTDYGPATQRGAFLGSKHIHKKKQSTVRKDSKWEGRASPRRVKNTKTQTAHHKTTHSGLGARP